MGFTCENLGRAKRLRYLHFYFFSWVCFLLRGFNGYKEWIIQLELKELQVVSGVFFLKDKGLGIVFSFSKGFFWVSKGGCGNSIAFQRRFFLRDWER